MSVVSKFMHNSKEVHLQVVYRILQYFKSSSDMRILFRKDTNLFFEANIDVNYDGWWIGD